MQSITPLTQADLLAAAQTIAYKFEVYDGADWINLCEMTDIRTDALAGWLYRKAIDISGDNIDATLTDFPVLVSISADADIGGHCLATGYDIRFTAGDGTTELEFERETFSVSAGLASGTFWVKIPTLTSAGKTIFIYYGNSTAADGQDPAAVWDSNYLAVLHMAGTTPLDDSTSNAHDPTNAGSQTTGKIGYGQDLNHAGGHWATSSMDAIMTDRKLTYSAWVYPHDINNNDIIVMGGYDPHWGYSLKISDAGTGTLNFLFQDTGGTWRSGLSTAIVQQNAWNYIWATFDYSASEIRIGINGTERTVATTYYSDNDGTDLYFGTGGWSSFDGLMDEVRISKIARTPAWLKFEYYNQASADGELDIGDEEPLAINCLKAISCQVAGAGKNTEPVAGIWSATINNEKGVFHPYHPTSDYADLFQLGRKARLSWGLELAPELLINGGFESWSSSTDCDDWTEYITGSSTVNREATTVLTGTYSCRLDIDSSNNQAVIYQNRTVTAGAVYRLSGSSKVAAGKTSKLYAWYIDGGTTYVLQPDGSWKKSGDPGYVGYSVLFSSTSWTCGGIELRIPAGVTTISIGAGTESAASSSAYFDDLSFKSKEKTEYQWQRIIGFMDTPRFDARSDEVAISGSDYSKILIDTKLFSPWVNWGTFETFDSQASPGGTGTEIYAEADACEIGAAEADNVTNWDCSASPEGVVTSEGPGSVSNYFLHFEAGGDDILQWAINAACGTITAGNSYTIRFYARAFTAGQARVWAYQTVGGAAIGIGSIGISGTPWAAYELIVPCTATGNLQLRVSLSGKYQQAGDTVDLDNISVKLYNPDAWNDYPLPEGCNGVYYVELDGEPVWQGDEDGAGGWHYDPDIGIGGTLVFSEELILDAGTDNLKIYYYTDTAVEDAVADLLVAGHLYASRALAKAAMSYTATGITIGQLWFESGTTAMAAIQMLCERANFRFWFNQDGTPNFHPAPTKATPSDFEFTSVGQLGGLTLYQDIEEIRNHVTIEGSQRSVLSVSTQQIEESTWKGDAQDAASIALYQEKTHSITNHLFQDQDAIDGMCAELLAYYKDPKFYLELTTHFMPAPIEVGDTITVLLRLSATETVTKYAIVRSISLQNGEAKYTGEIYVPFDTTLVVQDAALGLSGQDILLDYAAALSVQDAALALAAEEPDLEAPLVYTYTTTQAGTEIAIPTGYTQAVVECWGQGGAGGDGELVGRAGGGGGGGYAKTTLTGLTTSDKLYVYLPAAGAGTDTYVLKNSTDICNAGAGGDGELTGYGDGGTGNIGDVKYNGGNGYFYATGYTGGGGGSSAGTASNGNSATSSAGATAVTGGGNGGNGGARYNDGSTPTTPPGGGGGGAGQDLSTERYGGAGRIGQVKITLT